MADIVAVIPARLDSTRFPRKVIYPYQRKPLLFYVWNEVRKAKRIDKVVVATDNDEVVSAVKSFGGEAIKTKGRHATGTDRVIEAVKKTGGKLIVNVQADNFGISGAVLDRVITAMRRKRSMDFATLAYRLGDDDELFDPNIVKLVKAKKDDRALWFSRFPIPFLRGAGGTRRTSQHTYYGHIGIYFFRRKALTQFGKWPRGEAEKAESLEQLRIVENCGEITVFETRSKVVSVDTPDDLKKLDSIYK